MNIAEIARLAGVSPSAVSRYLNQGSLSREKREAIGRVIRETGYRPLAQAQALRTRKTRTIGVILPQIDSSPVGSMVAGIDSVLSREGFQLLLADSRNDPAKELEYLDLFDDQRVDGVVLIGTVFTSGHTAMLRRSRVPVVISGQRLEGAACVFHDDYQAFYDITSRLLEKGCRRLGYLGARPQDRAVGRERTRAYQDAVRDGGLAGQGGHTVVAEFTIASGRETARELWERFGPLDGVVCAADTIAAGALQYLRSRGVRVPEETRLTGQGGSELCHVTTPTLTTIRYCYEECGADAANLLLERLEKPELPPKEVKLGYVIEENESSR